MDQTLFPGISLNTLLPAIKANDEQVLRQLYIGAYPTVARYVQKNSGTEDDAKDIYQEAFLAAWRNIQLDKFQATDASVLPAYIFQIAKNKWIDHLRSRKNKHIVSLEDSMVNSTTNDTDMVSAENAEYLDTVKNEMKSLGERCRELLNRFYYHKQSIREIAQHFNWTEPSAKNNKYRCLQELRTLVKNKVQK